MKKTGVSSRHLTQLRICRGAFLGKKIVALSGIWAAIDWGWLSVDVSDHQLEQKL